MDDTSYITKFETGNGNKDRFNRLETFSADGSGLRSAFIASDSRLESFSASGLTDGFKGTMNALGEEGNGNMALVIMPRDSGGLKEIDISNSGLSGQSWRIGSFTYKAVKSSDKVVGAEAVNGGYPIGHEAGFVSSSYWCNYCNKLVSRWWTADAEFVCASCMALVNEGDVREKTVEGKKQLYCADCGRTWTDSRQVMLGGDDLYTYRYEEEDSDGDSSTYSKHVYGCSTCYNRGSRTYEQANDLSNEVIWMAMRNAQNSWALTKTSMGNGPVIDYQQWLPQLEKMTAYGNGICFHAYYNAGWKRRVTIDVTAQMRLGEEVDDPDTEIWYMPIAYINGYGEKGWVDEKGKTVQNWIYVDGKQVAYGSASCNDTSANWAFGYEATPDGIAAGDLISVRFRVTNGEEYTSMNLLVFPFGQ